MRIIADENIPLLQSYFSVFGEVVPVNGRALTADQVRGADALLVRSVTRVNAGLLADAPVKFVGTCTIGTDHLDTAYLQQAGIAYASAPGCNAGGVVQYVLTALSQLRENWLDLSVGIVGCGNVGGRLYRALQRLGVKCVAHDPFLTAESGFELVSLEEVLKCDAVCLHAPYTNTGPHPTHHLIGREALGQLQPGAFLLNAGRGGVIDNVALLAHLQEGADLQVVLDVWEGEPNISAPLARAVALGTPHIAGYSDEGRINGSIMIFRSLAEFLGWSSADIDLHLTKVAQEAGKQQGEFVADSLAGALIRAYDIHADHKRFMAVVNGDAPLGPAFDALRKHYPERHEPPHFQVTAPGNIHTQLEAAGFHVKREAPVHG